VAADLTSIVEGGLAFLSRRWGTSPYRLRHELTYPEFSTYLLVERHSYGEEATIAAYGTAAAIADVFGGKKSKALKKFSKVLTPKASLDGRREPVSQKSPGGHGMDELKRRYRALDAAGGL
jgi:hypothetical protein